MSMVKNTTKLIVPKSRVSRYMQPAFKRLVSRQQKASALLVMLLTAPFVFALPTTTYTTQHTVSHSSNSPHPNQNSSASQQDICQLAYMNKKQSDMHIPLFCRDRLSHHQNEAVRMIADQIATETQSVFSVNQSTPKTHRIHVKPFVLTHRTISEGRMYDVTLPGNKNGHGVEIDLTNMNTKDWLSSEYMLEKMSRQVKSKASRTARLNHESAIMEDQINRMKGQHYIDSKQAAQQYRTLLDNGVAFAKKHNLAPGSPLTVEQMKLLTNDIVWLVNEPITENGMQFEVLVPQIYIAFQLNMTAEELKRFELNQRVSEDKNKNETLAQVNQRTIRAYSKNYDLLGAESNYENMLRGLTLTVEDGISAVQDIMQHAAKSEHHHNIHNTIERIKDTIYEWRKNGKEHSLLEYLECKQTEYKKYHHSLAIPLRYLSV